MCIYMYIYIYIYMYVYIYTYIYMCSFTYTYISTYMFTNRVIAHVQHHAVIRLKDVYTYTYMYIYYIDAGVLVVVNFVAHSNVFGWR